MQAKAAMFKFPHIEEPAVRIKLIRHFIIVSCAMYLFQGLAIYCVSIWLAMQRMYACQFLASYHAANYLMLTASFLTLLIGIVGLYKACCHKNENLLRIFAFIFIWTLALEFMSAIVAHVHETVLSIKLVSDLTSTYSTFYTDPMAEKCVNSIQDKFKCCGVNSYTDILNNSTKRMALFPESCHCNENAQCLFYQGSSNVTIFKTPCYTKVFNRMTSYLTVFRIMGPVLAVVQIIFFCLGTCFVSRVQKNSVINAYIVHGSGHRLNSTTASPASESSVIGKEDDGVIAVVEASDHI